MALELWYLSIWHNALAYHTREFNAHLCTNFYTLCLFLREYYTYEIQIVI